MEGIMMRGPKKTAIAVRLADGNILTEIGNQFCLRFGCAGGVALTGAAANTGACATS